MTSLQEIEKLYYKAIEAAKLDEPAGGHPGPPGYSTGDFNRWARKVDIFTLGEGAANFALNKHEEIVKEFGEYRRDLTEKLSKLFSFSGISLPGQLRDIGSCWDGSKVGAVNEMDSLYVIQSDSLVLREHEDKRGVYRVFVNVHLAMHEVMPRTIRDQFTQRYSQLVSDLKLPNCLEHGGYKASRNHEDNRENPKTWYSDVRYNGPAATSQFLAKDNSLLTWDMTPAIVLPLDVQTQDAIRQSMQEIIADNPDKMFPPSDVHLIPDVAENVWRQSTAQMEADILRVLSKEGPMKTSLSFCKVLSSRLKRWADKVEIEDTATVDIINELLRNLAIYGTQKKTSEELDVFGKKMRFGHIFIPSDKKEQYCEDTKSNISINNAAVKHILFKAAMKRKGAFGPKENMSLVRELIQEVFQAIGNEEFYSSEHAFLSGIRISHFSVSPAVAHKKQTLARDVCRQCRTLVQEAMTEPTFTTEVDKLIDKLNKSISTPVELRCGEYSFQLKMNPWQHPIFNENIHHFLALVTSLRSGCGGVIYLMADDMETVADVQFQVYKDRLHALICKNVNTFPLPMYMVQVELLTGTRRTWAALLLKKSYDRLTYSPLETRAIWKPITLDLDKFGQIYTKSESESQSENYPEIERSAVSSVPRAASSTVLPSYRQESNSPQAEPELSASSATAPLTLSGHSEDTLTPTAITPTVVFSSCQRLDWTENTKDWQKYVKVKEVKIDDIVGSCPMWNPTQAMKITPDRDSLKYLFESEKDMEETLRKTTTREPGFAIVCRTWTFHISYDNATEKLPTGHICDILTVTDTGRLTFWVVVDIHDESCFESQMEYLMTTGRMLKFLIIQKETGDLSNLWIDCRLLPLTVSTNIETAVSMKLQECQEMQRHLYEMCHEGVEFDCLQKAVAKVILSKDSPLKRCVGDHTSITLTLQQAEVLMHKAKVNYITGPAGSGKSYTAALLYKMYGKDRSVYICTTKEFLGYLKFNGCAGTLVLDDQDLLREIKSGTFHNKICVVIDDCHRFKCTKTSLKKLFKDLKKNTEMSLFVFADNNYQSFDQKRQQGVHNCIFKLTQRVLNATVVNYPLTDIYRNTRKVVSFIQAAIQEVYDGHQKIESANIEDGDGVQCIPMSKLWKNTTENELVVYLRSLLLSKNYTQSEIAVLFDLPYTPDTTQRCKHILTEHIPGVTVQSADVFPRTGVIVDSVDSFLGLDASVCVFILSNTRKTLVRPRSRRIFQRKTTTTQCEMSMYNPRYEVFLASRATHKAVFVVPELHEDLVHQMKFDHFQPSAQFQGLRETTRHRIPWGYDLLGFCCDDNRVYCVVTTERWRGSTFWLTAYDMGDTIDGSLSLIDKVEVGSVPWDCCPRVDSSHRVYVPCGRSGVRIFCCMDGGLLPARDPLRCVRDACSVCFNMADTVFVCDMDTGSVCLVNVFSDTVIRQLERPEQAQGYPNHMSVLGQTVLVCYGYNTLVTYHSDSPTPGRLLQTPEGLGWVMSITTDCQSSSFLVTDEHSVFVLDDKLLWHRIYTGDRGLMDCAAVQSQLWLGYNTGDIAVLISQ